MNLFDETLCVYKTSDGSPSMLEHYLAYGSCFKPFHIILTWEYLSVSLLFPGNFLRLTCSWSPFVKLWEPPRGLLIDLPCLPTNRPPKTTFQTGQLIVHTGLSEPVILQNHSLTSKNQKTIWLKHSCWTPVLTLLLVPYGSWHFPVIIFTVNKSAELVFLCWVVHIQSFCFGYAVLLTFLRCRFILFFEKKKNK